MRAAIISLMNMVYCGIKSWLYAIKGCSVGGQLQSCFSESVSTCSKQTCPHVKVFIKILTAASRAEAKSYVYCKSLSIQSIALHSGVTNRLCFRITGLKKVCAPCQAFAPNNASNNCTRMITISTALFSLSCQSPSVDI